jgi:DNA-binding SARP family transcriptional activator
MEFRVLGPLEVRDGADRLPLGGPKQRALLARLLVDRGRPVETERLVDDLWGAAPPATAVKMVQLYVSRLRKVLPPGVLETCPPGYRLSLNGHELDLQRFELLRAEAREALGRGDLPGASSRLGDALELWRGPAFAEFPEAFGTAEASRLDELQLAATEERIELDLGLGRATDLVPELERLCALHPLRERLRGQLMLALYRCGRQAEALAAYRDFGRTLGEQLGLDPSPALRGLEGAILRQDAALAGVEHEAATDVAPRLPGRAVELRRLARALSHAEAGTRRAVFVLGGPGLGKSALVDAFLARISSRADLLVARGQCVERHGSGEPYLPILDALAHAARGTHAETVVRTLERTGPTWLAELPWLIPDERREEIERRVRGSTRERMLREMVETVAALAAQSGLVLVIEDLHWSDLSTLDLLRALARRREPARLLTVATLRPEGQPSGPAVCELARELCLGESGVELDLAGLDEEAAAQLLRARAPEAGPPPGAARLLVERTGGNPLYMTGLIDHWAADGRLSGNLEELATGLPAGLRQFIEDSFTGLDDQDAELLAAAAVAGREFSTTALTGALGLGNGEIERRCAELGREGRLVQAPGAAERYAFVHDLHREVLYDRIRPGRRAELHAAIGASLEHEHAPAVQAVAAELAAHFVAAGDSERAARYGKLAAQRAFARNAYEEGVEHVRGALVAARRLAPSPERTRSEVELLSLLGQALVALEGWSSQDSEAALVEASELARGLRDNEPLVSVLLALATLYELRGEFRHSERVAEQCMGLAPTGTPPAYLETHELLACNLFHQGSFARALEHAELGVALFEESRGSGHYSTFPATLGDNAGVSCHDWAGLALWFMGQPDGALERAQRALELAADPSRDYSLATAQAQMAFVHQCRMEPEPTLRFAEATLQTAGERGYSYRVAMGRILRGWALAAQGDHDAGIEELVLGLAASRATGAHMDDAHYLGLLSDAYLRAGQIETGLETVIEALELAAREPGFFFVPELERLRAELLRAGGKESHEVEQVLQGALALARQQGSRSLALRLATSWALLQDGGVRARRAREVVASIYGSFSEGFDTPDLRAAAALL